MIYCDNSATTLIKPKEVAQAVAYAIDHFGNPSRSFNKAALSAAREIYLSRSSLAKLINLEDPLKIAFTSGASESLNLVINGLVKKGDHIITTHFEHNSVLRPLYNSECELSFIEAYENGNLDYQSIEGLIKNNTKAIICNHMSNVTGNVVNVIKLKEIAKKNNLLLVLDVSQSLGSIEVDADMADVLCFTGHKSLFGPQGTGGIIMKNELSLKVVKTGGAGSNSFEKIHSLEMPDLFEVGTPNTPGIYGLKKGVEFVNDIGIKNIMKHKKKLTDYFINELKKFEGIKLYGEIENNYGVVAFNYKDVYSYTIAEMLYENYDIATRAQSHCAPLLHEFYQTKQQGMVRFSFSYLNSIDDIKICVESIKNIIEKIEKEN